MASGMTDDLAPRGADPHARTAADALIDRLGDRDELSAWALVETPDGRAFMILLIRDGSAPPRILFGAHQTGERSLPDRIILDDLDPDSVADAIAQAHARAVQRGEAAPGSRLRLVSTGTPTEGPRDVDLDRVPTARISLARSNTGVS